MEDQFEKLYLENQLCFPLYAASRLTIQLYGPYLKELDITYSQYLVLMVLWEHKEQTVNEIGERLFLESNTLTPLLKRLEQKGILSRKRSETDERSVVISLSDKGQELKKQACSIPDKIVHSFAGSSITETEVTQFKETLTKLISALSKEHVS